MSDTMQGHTYGTNVSDEWQQLTAEQLHELMRQARDLMQGEIDRRVAEIVDSPNDQQTLEAATREALPRVIVYGNAESIERFKQLKLSEQIVALKGSLPVEYRENKYIEADKVYALHAKVLEHDWTIPFYATRDERANI